MNLLRAESFSQGIILSTLSNILAKGLQFYAANIFLVHTFGISYKTDLFFYITSTISLIVVFITSLDSTVIIPKAVEIRQQNSMKESQIFINTFLYIYIILSFTLIIIFLVFFLKIFSLLSNFQPKVLLDNFSLFLLAIILLLPNVIINYLVNVLGSYKFFTIPTIISLTNSLCSIFWMYLFAKKLDVLSISFGMICGSSINIFFLFFFLKKKLKWNFITQFYPLKKSTIYNILYVQLAQAVSLITNYAGIFILSKYSNGVITAYNVSKTTADIPTILLTTQISSVIGIKFNELFAKREFSELQSSYLYILKLTVFFLLIISGLFITLSEEIIKILYSNKHNIEIQRYLTKFFKVLSVSLTFVGINMLTTRLIVAYQLIKYSFINQMSMAIILLFSMWLLSEYLGAIAVPLAFVIMYISNAIGYIFWLNNKIKVYNRIFSYTVLLCLLHLFIILISVYLKEQVDNTNIRILVIGPLYVSLIFILNHIFKFNISIDNQIKILFNKIFFK